MRRLSDAVVVITGASSGIGRAAARAFSEEGATVVLAARRADALREVAEECERAGGRALVVPTDVREEDQVRHLAQQAIDTFGRIDVWINNAGVTLFGRIEETPTEVYEGVIRTNLFGYIHGARAVLPYFREQGHGVLINNASVVAYVGQPYTSAYVISKAGIRMLGECLREELRDAPDIRVCTVLPATIDTPLFEHAANYTGRVPKAMPPVYPAEQVAQAMVQLARSPKREMFVGTAGRMLAYQHALAPGLTERMMARMVDRRHLYDRPGPPTPGNVLEPMPEWTGVSGGWRAGPASRSGSMMLPGLLLLALPIGLYAWYRQRQVLSQPRRAYRHA